MTKRELVIDVAEKLGYTQNEVSAVVQATLETITETLAEGNRLEIRNFGVFEIKKRDARIGRNPRTGEAVPITEKRVAVFKPGKMLKELVENQEPAPPAAPEVPAQPKPEPPAF
ncbi:MAG: integration host factor subunit beta [Candidatus Hydrogenedentes bacterium]|nr:integration host factor subunit beta [Candidatus Hydrogenedentota bacterium]